MKLYLIGHQADGEDYDLLVIANTPAEAQDLWGEHLGLEGETPTFIFHVAAASPVGYHEGPKVLEWGGVNLPRVGGTWPN